MEARRSETGVHADSPPSWSGAAVWRSLLFVPGGDSRKLERADSANADALIFDLEDSVESGSKERARALVTERLRANTGDSDRIVRINGCQTAFFERDVLDVVAAGASRRAAQAVVAVVAVAVAVAVVAHQELSTCCSSAAFRCARPRVLVGSASRRESSGASGEGRAVAPPSMAASSASSARSIV